jgi:hypothetical protein
MNITCECVDMRTSVGPHNTIKVEMEGVVLAGTVKTRDVLALTAQKSSSGWLSRVTSSLIRSVQHDGSRTVG